MIYNDEAKALYVLEMGEGEFRVRLAEDIEDADDYVVHVATKGRMKLVVNYLRSLDEQVERGVVQ